MLISTRNIVLPEDYSQKSKRKGKKKKKRSSVQEAKSIGTIISLWETTIKFANQLPQLNTIPRLTHVRTDLVLLLIMNGNDYLPKLRGSSGFQKLYNAYFKVLKEWFDSEETAINKQGKPFFVYWDEENNTLAFNLPFCIAFFRKLALSAPTNILREKEGRRKANSFSKSESITPLSVLHTYIDGGFLPKAKFNILPSNSTVDEYERVRLSLLPLNGDSILYNNLDRDLIYEIEHYVGQVPLQAAKQKLAKLALEDILGEDWSSQVNDDSQYSDSEDGSFPWEVNGPADCDVEK